MSDETATVTDPAKELKPFKPSALQNKFSAMIPKDLTEAMALCKMMANSDIVPKEFQKKPENLLIALGMGGELGLSPFQAMQNIMVVNGKPSMWGDAVLGLVRASGYLEMIEETYDTSTKTAICKVKRKGEPQIIRTFSMADAVAARLDKKDGPWQNYPRRMQQMRARSWALRDGFTDILKGLNIVEEARDIVDTVAVSDNAPQEMKPTEPILTVTEPTPAQPVVDATPPKNEPPANGLTDDQRKNIVKLMGENKVTPDQLKGYLLKRYGITEEKKPTAFVTQDQYATVCQWIEQPSDDDINV